MKSRTIISVITMLLLSANIAMANPDRKKEKIRIIVTEEASTETKARMEILQNRLNEIYALDYDKLSDTEIKDLDEEIKEIKDEVKVTNGTYIYISTGMLLVIILLIILL